MRLISHSIKHSNKAFVLFLLIQLTGSFQYCVAQQRTPTPYKVYKLQKPIKFDGLSDDDEWSNVKPLPMTMIFPKFRGMQSGRTEIRIAYDENYLYFSGQFFYADSTTVRGNTFARDKYSGDDSFDALIDSYNDKQNALKFTTNPLGNRNDAAILNDASGETDWFNRSWDGYWDVKTVIKDNSWFMELRIPFTTLRFQRVNGKVIMGMTLSFFKASNNSRISFPEVPQNIDAAHLKASLMQEFLFEGITPKKPVYITPYLLGGLYQNNELNNSNSAYQTKNKWTKDAGLDVKYNLSTKLTLDVTANTDFAQVEADDQQINLSRFSLFYPEKRRFFQEGSGIFDFNMGSNTNVFDSRRIGLSPSGQSLHIYGGARLVGRTGKTDIGVLSMEVAPHNEPGDTTQLENFSVMRIRHNIINNNSYIGGIVTSRIDKYGNYNFTYGADYYWNIKRSVYLLARYAQSFDSAKENHTSSGSRFYINLEDRDYQKWFYQFTFSSSGNQFNPGVGFVDRTNFNQAYGRIGYGVFPLHSKLQYKLFSFSAGSYFNKQTGKVESLNMGPTLDVLWNSGMEVLVNPALFKEDLLAPLPLSANVEIPSKMYTYVGLNISWEAPKTSNVRAYGNIYEGQYYDGWLHSFSIYPTWYASKYLELSPEYEFNYVNFIKRNQNLTSNIFRLRINTALNIHAFTNFFIQYSSLANQIVAQARVRYNFSEGRDIYLVYNENFNSDRANGLLPKLPGTQDRSIVIKFIYTFIAK